MKLLNVGSRTLCVVTAMAVLVGCGVSGAPISAPSVMQRGITGSIPKRASSSAYEVVYRFEQRQKGQYPKGAMVDVNGTLYGTTETGGLGHGVVYSMTSTGAEKTLYKFRGGSTDGADPLGDLIDVNGVLYGVTFTGGASLGNQHCNTSGKAEGCGTVFAVTPSGKEKLVYSFTGYADGSTPSGGLIYVNGLLYGVTNSGGAKGFGTIFSLNTTGTESVLHSFEAGADGAVPTGALAEVHGALYGTTAQGGHGGTIACGCGTVFETSLAGVEKVIYAFKGAKTDGAVPVGDLILVGGKLYGATNRGGNGFGYQTGCYSYAGCGTVYEITTSGRERVIYNFQGVSAHDGSSPNAGLVDVNHTLYGTTSSGGSGDGCSACGTIFSVTGTGTETVLHAFAGGDDGRSPDAGLVNLNGTLFGTTAYAQRHRPPGPGTVFSLVP